MTKQTKQIVINTCIGGFCLSRLAIKRLKELGEERPWEFSYDGERNHPWLIQVVEELGDEAGGPSCILTIVDIPHDVQWEIVEPSGGGGVEYIAEVHRTWK